VIRSWWTMSSGRRGGRGRRVTPWRGRGREALLYVRQRPELTSSPAASIYTTATAYILDVMSKHLVDIDEQALQAARAKLGTDTIKDTVNGALRHASGEHTSALKKRLEVLSRADLARREQAWR
jgi:Arc/MetJ family transcription regulator